MMRWRSCCVLAALQTQGLLPFMFRPPPSGSASFSSDASSVPGGRGLTSALSPSTLSFVSMSVDPPPPPAARNHQYSAESPARESQVPLIARSSPADSPVVNKAVGSAPSTASAPEAAPVAPEGGAAHAGRPSPLQTLLVKMTPVAGKAGVARAGDLPAGEDLVKPVGSSVPVDAPARREGPLPPKLIPVESLMKAAAVMPPPPPPPQSTAPAIPAVASGSTRYQLLVDQAVKRGGGSSSSSSKPVHAPKAEGPRDADVALVDRLKSLDSAIASLHTAGFGGSYASRHARSRK